jgi:2-polyprenyl-6-methoxyphenol hydroxylase-like FAD-dependent oxidoreductase
LRFEDGAKEDFDLTIFADGYNSLGRRYVSLETKQTYRGYVLWRGTVDRRRLSDGGRVLERSFFRLYYREGHAGVYLVPLADREENVSRANWGCYLPVRDLQAFLVDREGRQHSGSIPPGLMRASRESDRKLWAREALPPYFGDIVEASTDTFAQAIYTADVARYHRNRTCVLGDAGILVQPFTVSGVFKATNDALELAKALNGADDVDEALERWSAKETELGRRLLSVGERLEQLLIWRVPDFEAMDADSLQRWLDEIRSIQ